MQGSLQKQPQIKILPAFSVNDRLRLREADIDDVVKTVQDVLPLHVYGDIDVTITLLEKNLKIMAELARMKEALTHLVRNVMDAMPGYGKFPLPINQVNFKIESLLRGNDSIIGACAFISLAACAVTSTHESTGEYVDDSVITTKVKSLLVADDFLKSFQITVET